SNRCDDVSRRARCPRFASVLWTLTFGSLADATHSLKLSFAKQLCSRRATVGWFWQKRYFDRNVRDKCEFREKLRYLHRNPVKRGLVQGRADWKWTSFRQYA